MSVMIIPAVCRFLLSQLVKTLSIKVALVSAILVGSVSEGYKFKLKRVSKYSLFKGLSCVFKRSILKSSANNKVDDSIYSSLLAS